MPEFPRRWSAILTASIGLLWAAAGSAEGAPGDAFFADAARVVQVSLTMTPEAFEGLDALGPGADGARATDAHRNTFGVLLPWSRADLVVDGESFRDVGIRVKGNYTLMASRRSLEKSLKIDLDRNVEGQRIDGLASLTLNGGVSDPSGAREALAYAVFRAAGVPASRTALAEVRLTVPGRWTDEFVGVATVVEPVNKRFLVRHFGDSTGMLLKPEGLPGGPAHLGREWPPYADRYRPDKAPSARQKRRLIEFTELVSTADDEAFAAGIGSHLDVDAFLRFIAVNALLANLDSYLGYGHNYYLYLDPATERFVFIPWDLDLALATWPAAGPPERLVHLSLDHPHAGRNALLDRILAIPDHQARYREIVAELAGGCFTPERLLALLEPIEAALKEPLALEAFAVVQRGEGANGRFGQSMPPRRFIEERTQSVTAQLEGREEGFVPRPVGGPAPARR